MPFDDLAAGSPIDDDAIAQLQPDDPVTILYTSGTTGRPRGALSTNRAAMANIWNMAFVAARESILAGRRPPTPRQPATLSTAPLFHIGGVTATISSPMGGTKMVMMHKWNPERALELIERERITTFGGVPAMVWQVLDHPDFAKRDISSVRSIGYGGAPAAPELVRRIEAMFPGRTWW